MTFVKTLLAGLLLVATPFAGAAELRGTGDLGIAIERAKGSLQWLDTTRKTSLGRIEGLGDLSHASAVFSRDARHAYVFGRDGGLTKVDLLTGQVVKRVIQSGNSIGGAISQDGRFIAAANYTPGGVKIFAADTLDLVADIPTESKVIGLEDLPGNRFAFSLWDKGEIWVADLADDPKSPRLTKFTNIGTQPYDALISPDGRWYVAGLYGENGIAVLDTWNLDQGVKRALPDYGRGEEKLPVYKMPHLETWAMVGGLAFIPGVGRHEVVIVDVASWTQVGVIPVAGQPVFVMAQPDGRRLWVNFAFPHYDTVQVIDVPSQKIVQTLRPGRTAAESGAVPCEARCDPVAAGDRPIAAVGDHSRPVASPEGPLLPARVGPVLHMEFTPRGEAVWLSVRDGNRLEVYDTASFKKLTELPADAPSGIFFTARAHRFGL
ncbi:MAG: cytochrome D1 domain-containing protein [Pseudomonadota bacterium]